MSQQELELAICLNELFFDKVHGQICKILFQHNCVSLSFIVQEIQKLKLDIQSVYYLQSNTNMIKEIKRALCSLIQLNIVVVQRNEKKVLLYSYQWEALYARLRFPHYLCLTRLRCGEYAEVLVEELLVAGQLSAKEILSRTAKRLRGQARAEGKASPNVSDVVLALRELLGQRLIEQISDLVQNVSTEELESTNSVTSAVRHDEWDRFNAPSVDVQDRILKELQAEEMAEIQGNGHSSADIIAGGGEESFGSPPRKRLCMEASRDGVKGRTFGDNGIGGKSENCTTEIYYRVCLANLNEAWRDELLAQAAGRKVDKACASLLRVMLRKVESRNGANVSYEEHLSRAEIFASLPQDLAALPRIHIDQYLALLCDEAGSFVARVGHSSNGMYQCTQKLAWADLALCHIESLVKERYGARARRIFHTLVQRNYLEQGMLESACMMSPAECKELLYGMVKDGLIQVVELSRGTDYSAKAAVTYLFHVDLEAVARLLLQQCYQALHNLLRRRQHEQLDNKRLLEKQSRVEALAASLDAQLAELRVQAAAAAASAAESDDVTDRLADLEQQQAELPHLLTPGETAQLIRARKTLNLLSAAELELDEAVFVLHTFIKDTIMRGAAAPMA